MTLIVRSCLDLGLFTSTLPTTGNIWMQTLGYHLNQIFVVLNGGACVGNQVLIVPVLISEMLVCPFNLSFSESGPILGPRLWRGGPALHLLIFLPRAIHLFMPYSWFYFQHEETSNLTGTVVRNKWNVMHNTFRPQALNETKPPLSFIP